MDKLIKQVDANSAAELSALAQAIYKEHYLYLWHEGGAEWYMYQYAYDPGKIKNEMEDENNLHYILYENGKAQGYLKICINATLQGFEQLPALEVERIYLHKAATGKGYGKQLMGIALKIAKQYQKETVFLKAMDTSLGAILFYKKLGFEQCGTLQLPMPTFAWMKEEYRGMVILKKAVEYNLEL